MQEGDAIYYHNAQGGHMLYIIMHKAGAKLVLIYLTRWREGSVWVEIRGPSGATYLSLPTLHHTGWSTQKGMSTFKGLGG